MATPVVPSQFAVGKNRIIHKPTTATFSLETGHTTFKSINWGRAEEQLSSDLDYRKDDIIRVAQQASCQGEGAAEKRPIGRAGGTTNAWGDFFYISAPGARVRSGG